MPFAPITQEGAFDSTIRRALDQMLGELFNYIIPSGTIYFLDPVNGLDTNNGLTSAAAFHSLSAAYAACTAGKNDVVCLISDGTTSSTARVDAAFTWAKNATHLIGISSGVNISNRSRIAPTSTTTAFANFFTVSGSGCFFRNIQWFQGFATGTTSQIAMTVTGGRNLFLDCHIAGMGDNESAQSAGSRSLKISGTGENQFVNCTIGVDTISRTQANASVEFAGATPRNTFTNCLFPFQGAAGMLGVLGTGAACMDRFQLFQNCKFINNVKSSSTTMTALASVTSASPGGLLFFSQSTILGITKWGDTLGLANSYVDTPVPTAGTSGIAVNPA